MTMFPLRPLALLALLPLLAAPGCHSRKTVRHQAVLTVVVHDKNDIAWENVEVRILEAWTEYSACVCKAKEPWSVDTTDKNGEVVFDPQALAYAELGFEEYPSGVAVLASERDRDEALVKLLVGHDSLGWVRVDVPLKFGESQVDVFVQIDD